MEKLDNVKRPYLETVEIKRTTTDYNNINNINNINNKLEIIQNYDEEIGAHSQRSYTMTYSDTIRQDEIAALKRLKDYCAYMKFKYDINVYNDFLLLRLLRSARYKIKTAYTKLVNYIKFAVDYDIFNVNKVKFPNIDKIKLFYPHNFHKTTINGEPIFIQMLGQLKIDDINRILPEPLLTKYIIEKLFQLENEIFPKCSEKYNKNINKVFCIVDLLGLTTSLMNKNILNFVLKQMNIVSRYFPGILGGLYFINTGLIFRSIWTTCKFVIDSQTRSRIKLLSTAQYKSELFNKIRAENLPKFFGGKCNCDPYGCLFSNVGPWNEEEKTIGEKRRQVNHLNKILKRDIKKDEDDDDIPEIEDGIKDNYEKKEDKKEDDKKEEDQKEDVNDENNVNEINEINNPNDINEKI